MTVIHGKKVGYDIWEMWGALPERYQLEVAQRFECTERLRWKHLRLLDAQRTQRPQCGERIESILTGEGKTEQGEGDQRACGVTK